MPETDAFLVGIRRTTKRARPAAGRSVQHGQGVRRGRRSPVNPPPVSSFIVARPIDRWRIIHEPSTDRPVITPDSLADGFLIDFLLVRNAADETGRLPQTGHGGPGTRFHRPSSVSIRVRASRSHTAPEPDTESERGSNRRSRSDATSLLV